MVDAKLPTRNSPPAANLMGLHGWLLLVWFAASFGLVFFAHDLQQVVAGWPVSYWFAAQGSVIVFIGIVAVFAWVANRREEPAPEVPGAVKA
jgi:cation/acetate symporter